MKIRAIIIILLLANTGYSVRFENKDAQGNKYRIKQKLSQDIYMNGKFIQRREGQVKAVLTVEQVTNDWSYLDAEYFWYSKNAASREPFKLKEKYLTRYLRHKLGQTKVIARAKMPVLRGLPRFPDRDLQPGETWTYDAEEFHEGSYSGVQKDIAFKIKVNYRYIGEEIIDGKPYEKFIADYHALYYPTDTPRLYSFTGFSHLTYYWDVEKGRAHSYADRFSFMITTRNGETYLFDGTSHTFIEDILTTKEDEKDSIVKQIEKDIKSTEGLNVKKTPDGIVINIEDVLFDINHSTLKKEALPNLGKVAEILRKLPHLDIAISGHTDNTGSAAYNLTLSEQRAFNVANFMMNKGLSTGRMSYIGFGENKPIAPNTTPEGRKQNRRVEIKILTRE